MLTVAIVRVILALFSRKISVIRKDQIMDKSDRSEYDFIRVIYDVTDLDVYNRALKALHLIYKLEKQIPKSHYKLSIQLTSATEGIPAHIAEGFAKRRFVKEFMRFLEIGMGSRDETITQTRAIRILADHIKGIDKNLCDEIIAEYKIISKQLNNLRNKWVDYNKK